MSLHQSLAIGRGFPKVARARVQDGVVGISLRRCRSTHPQESERRSAWGVSFVRRCCSARSFTCPYQTSCPESKPQESARFHRHGGSCRSDGFRAWPATRCRNPGTLRLAANTVSRRCPTTLCTSTCPWPPSKVLSASGNGPFGPFGPLKQFGR
jgi:hypothetical protein